MYYKRAHVGTGKTRLLISAILRLCGSHRVLAVAPSDAAADVILLRLTAALDPTRLFRLNWWQRGVASVPAASLRHCSDLVDGLFGLPCYEALAAYGVIVTTCAVAGCLRHLLHRDCSPAPALLFDCVLIDEAAQATEAESLAALSLCRPAGALVLAGDTQQLGPSYRSPAYSEGTLHPSLEERLLALPAYAFLNTYMPPRWGEDDTLAPLVDALRAPAPVHPALGVFLTQNYRSHRHIFAVSSRLFYANSLEECGDPAELNSLVGWSRLPQGRPFPVLVRAVDGVGKHVRDSPSYYNAEEALAVVEVCRSLLGEAGLQGRVSMADIGVIGAFRRQVLLIREELRRAGLREVSVGSVEDFQGQEKRVVVISTVLHRAPPLRTGEHVGLFGDHRRFNVAVTRGMALVVVVGHPAALCGDAYFKELVEYAGKYKGYEGFESLEVSVKKLDSERKGSVLGGGVDMDSARYQYSYYSDGHEIRGV